MFSLKLIRNLYSSISSIILCKSYLIFPLIIFLFLLFHTHFRKYFSLLRNFIIVIICWEFWICRIKVNFRILINLFNFNFFARNIFKILIELCLSGIKILIALCLSGIKIFITKNYIFCFFLNNLNYHLNFLYPTFNYVRFRNCIIIRRIFLF